MNGRSVLVVRLGVGVRMRCLSPELNFSGILVAPGRAGTCVARDSLGLRSRDMMCCALELEAKKVRLSSYSFHCTLRVESSCWFQVASE